MAAWFSLISFLLLNCYYMMLYIGIHLLLSPSSFLPGGAKILRPVSGRRHSGQKHPGGAKPPPDRPYHQENTNFNAKDQEDLISIGTIGLIKAINTFNSERAPASHLRGPLCIENAILSQWISECTGGKICAVF